jgi:hypothetical protein
VRLRKGLEGGVAATMRSVGAVLCGCGGRPFCLDERRGLSFADAGDGPFLDERLGLSLADAGDGSFFG